ELLAGLVEMDTLESMGEELVQDVLEEMGVDIPGEDEKMSLALSDYGDMEATEDDVLFKEIEESPGVMWEDDLVEGEPLSNLRVCPFCGAFVREEQERCEVCGEDLPESLLGEEGLMGEEEEIDGADALKSFLGVKTDVLETIPHGESAEAGAVYLCSNCGAFMKEGEEACGICGTSVEDMEERPPDYEGVGKEEREDVLALCKNCGAFIYAHADKCDVCGTALDEEGIVVGGQVEEREDKNDKDEGDAAGAFQRFLGSGENVPIDVVEDGGEIFLCPECGAFMSSKAFWCPVCNSFVGEGITEEEARELITDEIQNSLEIDGLFSDKDAEGAKVEGAVGVAGAAALVAAEGTRKALTGEGE
ncbi:MAG: hypothetical protein KAT70_00195, partial [Thermoplasmata archaeon]|nr:hypothetical protein [Thermoplasmata archaeon]